MASTFDLNNVFVYYIWAINPAQEFSDMLSVLRTDQITLSFGDVTYDPPIDLSALQGSPEVLASTSFKNDTDVTDSAQFQQNKSTTASFSGTGTSSMFRTTKGGCQTIVSAGFHLQSY